MQRLADQANIVAAKIPPPSKPREPKPEEDPVLVALFEKQGIRIRPGSQYVTPAQRMARKAQG